MLSTRCVLSRHVARRGAGSFRAAKYAVSGGLVASSFFSTAYCQGAPGGDAVGEAIEQLQKQVESLVDKAKNKLDREPEVVGLEVAG